MAHNNGSNNGGYQNNQPKVNVQQEVEQVNNKSKVAQFVGEHKKALTISAIIVAVGTTLATVGYKVFKKKKAEKKEEEIPAAEAPAAEPTK